MSEICQNEIEKLREEVAYWRQLAAFKVWELEEQGVPLDVIQVAVKAGWRPSAARQAIEDLPAVKAYGRKLLGKV